MTELGHGAYWGPFTLMAIAAAISLAAGSGLALARLHRRLAGTASFALPDPSSAPLNACTPISSCPVRASKAGFLPF